MRISDWSSDGCSSDLHKWHIGQGDQGSFYTALVGCRYAQGYRARNPILGSIVYQSLKMGPLQRRVACYNETRGKRYGCQSLRGVMTKGLTSHGSGNFVFFAESHRLPRGE